VRSTSSQFIFFQNGLHLTMMGNTNFILMRWQIIMWDSDICFCIKVFHI